MLDTKFACLKVCHRVKAELELVHIPSSHPPTNISDPPASTHQGLGYYRHQPPHPALALPLVGFPGSGIMPVLECSVLFNFLLRLFICCVGIIHLHVCHGMDVETRRQRSRASSLFPPDRFLKSHSGGCGAWQQAPLPC